MGNFQSDIRKQVLAAITAVMENAMANGADPYDVAERTFPGTPKEVLLHAFWDAKDPRTEAWWRQVEETIDVHAVRVALAGPVAEPVPAGPRDAELDLAFDALCQSQGRAA